MIPTPLSLFHFNVSLAALNQLRLEDRQLALEGAVRNVISIASWKTRKFNAHLLERFSSHLALDFTAIKSSPAFAALWSYRGVNCPKYCDYNLNKFQFYELINNIFILFKVQYGQLNFGTL
jgi:hypothetical protein